MANGLNGSGIVFDDEEEDEEVMVDAVDVDVDAVEERVVGMVLLPTLVVRFCCCCCCCDAINSRLLVSEGEGGLAGPLAVAVAAAIIAEVVVIDVAAAVKVDALSCESVGSECRVADTPLTRATNRTRLATERNKPKADEAATIGEVDFGVT